MRVKANKDVHVPLQFSAKAGDIVAVSDELAETLIARGLVEKVKAVAMVEDIEIEKVTLTDSKTKKKFNK